LSEAFIAAYCEILYTLQKAAEECSLGMMLPLPITPITETSGFLEVN